MRVFNFIKKEPEATALQIAREVDLTERTVLRILNDLEDDGHIIKELVGRKTIKLVNKNSFSE